MPKALANPIFDMTIYETLVLSVTQMILYKICEFCIQTAATGQQHTAIATENLKISSAHWQQNKAKANSQTIIERHLVLPQITWFDGDKNEEIVKITKPVPIFQCRLKQKLYFSVHDIQIQ